MNDILKQRVVGALILLALGVVFWPVIFVEPDEEKSAERAIPPGAEVSTADIDKPVADNPVAQAPVASALPPEQVPLTEAVASPVQTSPAAAPTEVSAATPVPTAAQRSVTDSAGAVWTLQVATVSSSEKADSLRRQLLELKRDVYVTTVHSGGKNLYRVCIGRGLESTELERLQVLVNARFGVTSMVARYTP